VAARRVTGDANLKKAQYPWENDPEEREPLPCAGKSETLQVTTVPVTATPACASCMVIVPVGDVDRILTFTPIPSIVIAPGVNAEELTNDVVKYVDAVVSLFNKEVESIRFREPVKFVVPDGAAYVAIL